MACSESTVVVRYAETDQMGVVHHAVYPVWYEVARTDCIKKIGVTYAELERMGGDDPGGGFKLPLQRLGLLRGGVCCAGEHQSAHSSPNPL